MPADALSCTVDKCAAWILDDIMNSCCFLTDFRGGGSFAWA